MWMWSAWLRPPAWLDHDLGDLIFIARYEFSYLHIEDPLGDYWSNGHRARVGVGKTLKETPNHSIYASANAVYEFAVDPDSLERFEYSGRLSWSWRILQRLRSNVFYRLSVEDYLNSARQDVP